MSGFISCLCWIVVGVVKKWFVIWILYSGVWVLNIFWVFVFVNEILYLLIGCCFKVVNVVWIWYVVFLLMILFVKLVIVNVCCVW